jgi:hypothetical protein
MFANTIFGSRQNGSPNAGQHSVSQSAFISSAGFDIALEI